MHVTHYYPRALVGDGGPTVAMWGWAGALADLGHEVSVVYDAALTGNQPLAHPAAQLIPVSHHGRGRTRLPADFTRDNRPDVLVLHSVYTPANLTAARHARRRGVPYVVCPHGGYDRQSRARSGKIKQVWNLWEGRYLEQAAAMHVFYESEIDHVHDMVPDTRWIVVPTGIDIPNERWSGGPGPVVWLGRYDVEHKGLDLLLHGLASLPPTDRPQVQFYGKDSRQTAGDVMQLVRSLGLEGWVAVSGPVYGAEKRKALLQSSGYVHPSRWESHGIALFETLALGVPAAASIAVPVVRDLASYDAAIPLRLDAESVAAGLLELVNADRVMGERARDLMSSWFAWDVVGRQFVDQLEAIL